MKLTVLQENLNKALLLCIRFTSARAPLPVLGNILISGQKTKLVIAATNLESAIVFSLGAQVKEDGEITVPAKTISEFIANLPAGPLTLETEKESLKVSTSDSSSRMAGMNSADFPAVPRSLTKTAGLILEKENFTKALLQVLPCVSLDETRPVLTGALMVFQKNALVLVATDGFRLAQKKISLPKLGETKQVVIPKSVLLELTRLGEAEDKIILEEKEKEKQVLFGSGNLLLSSRILEGNFPDYEKIIPKTSVFKIRVDKEEFLRAVKLASVFARDSANIVKLVVEKDRLSVLAESSQAGSQKTTLEARVEGGNALEIAFNYRFLEDFVNAVAGEEISLEFTDAASPGVFTDPKDPDYLHLIMPVKIQE